VSTLNGWEMRNSHEETSRRLADAGLAQENEPRMRGQGAMKAVRYMRPGIQVGHGRARSLAEVHSFTATAI